ncbi:LON peptidase substrate-binding domain-containing protein [Oceanospirillum sp.]|uniref:LON peptidase substrate-binding domain-containing protein n=1 Tax=Oceanospirillum sp. TaxID=2021254 RepID=UPI003A8CCD6A
MEAALPKHISLVVMPRVLFPQTFMALNVLEPRYERMVKTCLSAYEGLGILFQMESLTVRASEEQLDQLKGCTGTYGLISDWYPQPDNTLALNIDGLRRFRVMSATQESDGLIRAEVQWLPEEKSTPVSPEHQHLADLLKEITHHPLAKECDFHFNLQDAKSVSLNLAHLLPLPDLDKQQLLECDTSTERLRKITSMLSAKKR